MRHFFTRISRWITITIDHRFAETCQVLSFGNKKPPVVRAAPCICLGVLVLHSHRCHPNRNQVLKNKDHNNDDNKGEAED
jgi:hypothetical protein